MKSDRKILSFPNKNARKSAAEMAFLPAALEVVETPASPAGRAVAATVIAVFCFALLWASLGHIDIVASASGKIIPSGGIKVVQPFETGIVRAIHVTDGQRVNVGDILIELDPTMNESERNHLQADLTAAQLEMARLKAGLADVEDPLTAFQPPANASQALIDVQRDYLVKQTAEYRAKIKAIERQREQKQAERATIEATISKLLEVIPIVQQRVDIRKISSDREYTSKYQYFEALQVLVEQQQDLNVQRSRLQEADASIAALTDERSQSIAEFQRTLFGQLVEAERKADGLAYDVAKSQQKINAQFMTAPIAGTVQQLAIHTVGGVVTPAQMLLAIVPLESRLEIEAMVPNRDVGFVHPGQKAEIKVDTFNFTKYGLLQGQVVSVSRDAIVRDKPTDRSTEKNLGSQRAEPKVRSLISPRGFRSIVRRCGSTTSSST